MIKPDGVSPISRSTGTATHRAHSPYPASGRLVHANLGTLDVYKVATMYPNEYLLSLTDACCLICLPYITPKTTITLDLPYIGGRWSSSFH